MSSTILDWTVKHWEAFRQSECRDIFQSPCYPLQRKQELAEMLELAARLPTRVYCEVGASRGGGLYCACDKLQPSKVIAIEPNGLPYHHEFELMFPTIQFLWLAKSSHNSTQDAVEFLSEESIDTLFLDGDKSSTGRTKDYQTFTSLMGCGLVLMHDIRDGHTGSQWQSIRDKAKRAGMQTQEIIYPDEYKQVLVPKTPYESWLKHWRGKSAGVGVIHYSRSGATV